MDKLKELLGEELYKQVAEKLGDNKIIIDDGNWIPKARFDEVNVQRKDYKEQLEQRDQQLKDLQKKAKDSEELTSEIERLREENKKATEAYEEKLTQQKFNFAVEQAIAKAEAKNTRAVKALLDLDKIKLEGDELIGLEEQLKTVKESEPYLFGTELRGRTPHQDQTTPPSTKNPWKSETFNLTEQGRLLKEDPELAKKLKQQAGVE